VNEADSHRCSKTELQDELDRLRQQMQATANIILSPDSSKSIFPPPPVVDFSSNMDSQASLPHARTYSTESPAVPPSLATSDLIILPTPVIDNSVRNGSVTSASTSTSPQKLHGLEIEGAQIDDCFGL
jgi:hypothetical protein